MRLEKPACESKKIFGKDNSGLLTQKKTPYFNHYDKGTALSVISGKGRCYAV